MTTKAKKPSDLLHILEVFEKIPEFPGKDYACAQFIKEMYEAKETSEASQEEG